MVTGNTPPIDPYAVLDLDPGATPEQIKTAYFTRVREHPPERDPEGFKRIRAAYEQLRDPAKRRETDLLRLHAWPEPSLERIFAEPDPAQAARLDPADVIAAARAVSDVARRDFREDFREVKG
ncbi:MAG TPA: J domain-containing protein [Anaerolineae bacterium]|nr:J domain-containing protein [Anaerolineae bacterium]